jgi:hypothetical protein
VVEGVMAESARSVSDSNVLNFVGV